MNSLKNQVSEHLEKENNKINQMVSVINDHDSVLRKLVSNSDNMVENINELSGNLVGLKDEINETGNVNSLIVDFMLALMQSEKLRGGIESLIIGMENILHTGRVGPEILQGAVLINLLEEMEKEGVILPFSAEKTQLYKYFDIFRGYLCQDGGIVYVFISMPIDMVRMGFNLYRVENLWVPQEKGWGSRVMVNDNLVVISNNSKFMGNVRIEDECLKSGKQFFCIHERVWLNAEGGNCVLQLFQGEKGNISACNYEFAPNFSPQFVKVPGGVIASVNKAMILQVDNGISQDIRRVPRKFEFWPLDSNVKFSGDNVKFSFIREERDDFEIKMEVYGVLNISDNIDWERNRNDLVLKNLSHFGKYMGHELSFLADDDDLYIPPVFGMYEYIVIFLGALCIGVVCLVTVCYCKHRREIKRNYDSVQGALEVEMDNVVSK